MEDYLLMNKYKGSKSYGQDSERDLFKKFKEFMAREPYLEEPYDMKEHSTRNRLYREMKSNDNFTIDEAEHLVNHMFHYDGNRKHTGEKYSISKAKEVCERYRGMIPSHVNYVDVYVAINAQYHDYGTLYKSWFGDNIDSKIIESAIIFWFRDDDYLEENKLKSYFNEM